MLASICERSETLFAEPGNVERMIGLDANAPTARFRELVASDMARIPKIVRAGYTAQVARAGGVCTWKRSAVASLGREPGTACHND